MSSLLIGFLTLVLVFTCVFLILLVLIQLPKKEAGAGIAFGGAATDALFGAGSGNALTKLTKYSAGIFVVLSLGLSILNVQHNKRPTKGLEEQLLQKAASPGRTQPLLPGTNLTAPITPPVTPVPVTSNRMQSTPPARTSNAAPAGSPAAAKPGTTGTAAPAGGNAGGLKK